MRLAMLSDIHANLPALEAVLADARRGRASTRSGAWATWSATAPSRTSAPTWSRERCAVCLVGNHDLAALEQLDISTFSPGGRGRGPLDPGADERPRRASSSPGSSPPTRAARSASTTPRRATRSGSTCSGPIRRPSASAPQARRVSFVGHSHVALFFALPDRAATPATPTTRAAPRRAPAPASTSRRGRWLINPGQRRPAARRRPARRLARARHRGLAGDLPPGRLRHRPRRRRDRRHRPARAPRPATLRGAMT